MKRRINCALTVLFGVLAFGAGAQDLPHHDHEHDTLHVDEITISSNREQTLRRQAPALIDIATPRTMVATNAVCLAQTLDFMPGLRVEDNCQNCGFTQVRINGLDGHYSQILIDSKPIFSSLSGVYGLEQIPAEMIDRIEVMRGGGSALFGASAVAGVINIITKEATENGGGFGHMFSNYDFTRTFDNTTHAYASAVTRNHNAGIYLFAQDRHRDPYDRNGDAYSDLPKLRNLSVGLNAFVRPTRLSKLSVRYNIVNDEHRGGNNLGMQPHESNISEGAAHLIHSGHLDYHIDFGHQHVEAYTALQHIRRNSYYGGIGEGTPEERIDALKAYGYTTNFTLATGALWRYHFDKLWFMPASLTVGAEYNFDHLTDSIPGYAQYLHQDVHIGSVYAQNEWKNEKWSLLAGVRMDKHSLIRRPIFSPRVNIRYNPIRRLSLRVSYATGFRAPQTYDEDLHVSLAGGERIISTLAPDLKEERSHSVSLSADYCLYKGGVDVDLTGEGFYTYLKDIFAERRYEDAAGNEVSERYNAGRGYVTGIHGAVKVSWNRWISGQLGATWQVSRYTEPVEWSEDAAPEIRMLRTPNVYGYLIIESNPWRHLTLNVTGNFTGPMLVPHETEPPVLVKTQSFFVLNAQVSYDFHFKIQRKSEESFSVIQRPSDVGYNEIMLRLTAGVQNITNAYQPDLDYGVLRDAGYIYGPKQPRSVYLGFDVKI